MNAKILPFRTAFESKPRRNGKWLVPLAVLNIGMCAVNAAVAILNVQHGNFALAVFPASASVFGFSAFVFLAWINYKYIKPRGYG